MIRELGAADPRTVGPYRLLGRLGAGGMGQVFIGRSSGGRLVAVKVIRPELAGEPGFRARFAREVAAARNVCGLFTALVIDADEQGLEPWLATAYVAGPSLAEAVEERGALPAASVLTLAAGLAEGLAAIHAAGVVHRDLKPSNVLLADDGPRVIDFGISRAAEATMLTQSGMVVGSPGFMSPEQAEGGPVGPPSDVFSLGAVLTFAATGAGPFGTGSTAALIYRVVHRSPDIAAVPADIRPLVERCLAKDPAERPAPADLLAELGAGELSAGWLPAPLSGVLGRYAPPARESASPGGSAGPALAGHPASAGSPAQGGSTGSASTQTGAARRTPTAAAAVLSSAEPGRPPRRVSRRRLIRATAAAGLVVALVPVSFALSLTGRHSGSSHAPASSPRPGIAAAAAADRPIPAVMKAASSAPSKERHGNTSRRASRTVPGIAASAAQSQPGTQAQPAARQPAARPASPVVPNVLGLTLPAAASVLRGRGFDNIPYLYGCYGSQGTDDVVRQAPGAGALIARSAPVQLYLQANNCRTVPNVAGMSLPAAASTLKAAGFSNIPYVYECYGSSHIGAVVSQSPAPGTSYGDTQPVSLRLQANNC